jgi:hypothetical protein
MKRFVELPFQLYRNDPNWSPPMLSAQRQVLACKTAFFDKGRRAEMALFLAERFPCHAKPGDNARQALRAAAAERGAKRSGVTVGRIAAIHNKAHNAHCGDGVGFFGFFECEARDPQAAEALLRSAEGWLRARGLKTLRGPVSPSMGSECGLLIDGFDRPAMVMMPYNPRSYAGLLESLGLRKCKDMYAYLVTGEEVRPGTAPGDRLVRLASAMRRRRPEVSVRALEMRNYPRDILRFMDVFEDARKDNWGYVPLTREEILETTAQMRRVIDPRLILFAEVHGEPAGALLALPNINRALAAVNGRLWPLGFVKFFRELKRVRETRVLGVATLKKYRSKGITAMLFLEEIIRSLAGGYRYAEASWVLEDNQLSDESIRSALVPQRYKTYRIYEKPL